MPACARLRDSRRARWCNLSRYSFPGNVRELENLLHRAVALSGGEEIDVVDLGLPDAMLTDSERDRERDAETCRFAQGSSTPTSSAAIAGSFAGQPRAGAAQNSRSRF